MDMRHRSDTPQDLGDTGHLGCEGHLGVWGVWGHGAYGGCKASGGVCVRHRPRCPGPAHTPDAEAG